MESMGSQMPRYNVAHGPKYDQILEWIGRGQSILDVGCGTGSFSKRLMERENQVMGVEFDPAHAEVAREKIPVLEGDFRVADIPGSFDVVLFADVLEHMQRPDEALRRAREVAPTTIVCVPNFEMFAVRLMKLVGITETETGILDKTHVYPFTKAAIEDMLRSCGWTISDYVSPAPKRFPRLYNRLIARSPAFFGYQFMYRCEQ